ncbi:transmembrane protein 223-domain-containing protein [Polychytrium aggregatum]|uniref:transmembrane protein 223-domain-containing protein n=1 Tax=Polychytrium aggregatum TaxID=110093 RepID=UPI0022FDF8DE|nr:transmembrane protein 223-domain-containing protein [Polychytrium aggregatum]KAI9207674.1 transmembrane protein 223-domain-containing protein [Polychytrium aggregatum]
MWIPAGPTRLFASLPRRWADTVFARIRSLGSACRPHSTATGHGAASQWLREDVQLYVHKNQLFLKGAYFLGASQLFMWLNIAELAWSHLASSESDSEGIQQYQPASMTYRWAATGFCIGVGVVFMAVPHVYASKRIKQLTLLRGGKEVMIQTSNLLGRNKYIVPATRLKAKERCSEARSQTASKSPASGWSRALGSQDYYLMEYTGKPYKSFLLNRGATFSDRKLFDTLFFKP